MAYEPLFDATNATPFKFETVGTVLEGHYMGSFDYQGDYGPTKKHIFDTESGAVVVFGQRNLMQQLPGAKVGAMVEITYTGDKQSDKKGRQPMKLFKIRQDKKNTREVSGVEFNAPQVDDDVTDTDVDAPDTIEDIAPPPARAAAPAKPAAAPDAARAAKVQELLARGKAAKTA
jgi:hypothetical protein